jgi:hypothetical protein
MTAQSGDSESSFIKLTEVIKARHVIEYQHSRLRIPYQTESALCSALDDCDHSISLKAGRLLKDDFD